MGKRLEVEDELVRSGRPLRIAQGGEQLGNRSLPYSSTTVRPAYVVGERRT